MSVKHEAPAISYPLRVLFEFESNGWFEASAAEREQQILPALKEVLASWEALGAKLVGTLDRDVFTAGRAGHKGWHAVWLYDVPDLQSVVTMTHQFRATGLDRYFRLEAVVGRKFFLLER